MLDKALIEFQKNPSVFVSAKNLQGKEIHQLWQLINALNLPHSFIEDPCEIEQIAIYLKKDKESSCQIALNNGTEWCNVSINQLELPKQNELIALLK